MKRDWNLIREQLLAIEEDQDFNATVIGVVPPTPKWVDQSEDDYNKEMKAHEQLEERIYGHLEMLVKNGYIDGLTIERSSNSFAISIWKPRLTMAGHDLLDTMRSKTVWAKIQSTAKEKGLELTFDTIKALALATVKSIAS